MPRAIHRIIVSWYRDCGGGETRCPYRYSSALMVAVGEIPSTGRARRHGVYAVARGALMNNAG